MSHTCHAHGCSLAVPPKMLFCRAHWAKLGKPYQAAIWREYRQGQENDKRPSVRYLAVQRLAVAMVAFKPRSEPAAAICAQYLAEAETWRQRAMADGAGDPFEGLPLVSPAPAQMRLL